MQNKIQEFQQQKTGEKIGQSAANADYDTGRSISGSKKTTKKRSRNYDSDEDDFFDRTRKQTLDKKLSGKKEEDIETVESLELKIAAAERQKRSHLNRLKELEISNEDLPKKQSTGEDILEQFMQQNADNVKSTLVKETIQKLDSVNTELERLRHLLNIARPAIDAISARKPDSVFAIAGKQDGEY